MHWIYHINPLACSKKKKKIKIDCKSSNKNKKDVSRKVGLELRKEKWNNDDYGKECKCQNRNFREQIRIADQNTYVHYGR